MLGYPNVVGGEARYRGQLISDQGRQVEKTPLVQGPQESLENVNGSRGCVVTRRVSRTHAAPHLLLLPTIVRAG